ncbi:MAG: polysaccharide deacetylase family protein, partial [Porphyromonadaceae bacterium]|nr:polysaccharide deacetylase family protein [Porphyromonadaceae bacterium]
MNHLQGLSSNTESYLQNVETAREWISSPLFRPPHGHLRFGQSRRLRQQYKIVMWDVVTRDYSKKLSGEQVLGNVRKYARNGSIIVFHDSLKGEKNLRYALPKAISWLKEQGYRFALLP